jgi:hypothetical protein
MRKLSWLTVWLLFGACNSSPVSPSAKFTLQGQLTDQNGNPAAATQVEVIKVDSALAVDDDFLLDPSYDSSSAVTATYYLTTDATGTFSHVFQGSEVNAASGNSASNLSVLYKDPNDALVATATSFFSFTDQNPVQDVGNLMLWGGTTASQDPGTGWVTFSWSAAPANSTPEPAYYYFNGYDNLSTLTWRSYTTSTSVLVPRVAFASTQPQALFVFGHNMPNDGSQVFQNRADFPSVTGWGTSAMHGTELPITAKEGSLNGTTMGAATDGDLTTQYTFSGTTDFYVDVSGSPSVGLLLLYDLVLTNMYNAVITLWSSTDAQNWLVVGFYDVAQYVEQTGASEDFAYLPFELTGAAVQWLHVNVALSSYALSAIEPTLDRITEVRVFD